MNREISAGTVTAKKMDGGWSVLLIRDMKDRLTFPKGIVEQGEDPETAAVRETKEETGIASLRVKAELPSVVYHFTRNGKAVRKTVHYFVCTTSSKKRPVPQVEEGISEIVWMPVAEAVRKIGYPKTNRPLIHAAREILGCADGE